jgi:hypothetical protein
LVYKNEETEDDEEKGKKKRLDVLGEKEAATMIVFACLCRELLLVAKEIFVSLFL